MGRRFWFFRPGGKRLVFAPDKCVGRRRVNCQDDVERSKAEEIIKAIVQGNTKQLESVKGIGRKTGERLIVELRDKLGKITMENISASDVNIHSAEKDAIAALTGLGIAKPMAESAVKKVSQSAKEILSLEEIIKQALKTFNL